MNNRRKIILGLGTGSVLSVWHKPIVNAIVLPAHAQTSPTPAPAPEPAPAPPPPVICPDIIVGNAQSSALSGADTFTSCGVTFDIFSSDPATPLEITGIANSALATGVTVSNDGLGPATDSSGPRVTWLGPISGSAPDDCSTPSTVVPADDVTFTITATCEGATEPVELVITLTAILAAA